MRQTRLALELRPAPRASSIAIGDEQKRELVQLMADAIVAVARGPKEREATDEGQGDE